MGSAGGVGPGSGWLCVQACSRIMMPAPTATATITGLGAVPRASFPRDNDLAIDSGRSCGPLRVRVVVCAESIEEATLNASTPQRPRHMPARPG